MASMATLGEIEHSLRRVGEFSRTGDVRDPDRVLAELHRLLARWNSQVGELAKLSPRDFNSPEVMCSMHVAEERSSFHRVMSSPMASISFGGGGRMRQ
jgi:hypothetical protein